MAWVKEVAQLSITSHGFRSTQSNSITAAFIWNSEKEKERQGFNSCLSLISKPLVAQ